MSTSSIAIRTSLGLAGLLAWLPCASASAAAAPPYRPASASTMTAPSAAGFALAFVATANAYARAHGDHRRVVDPDCVEAARGRYMCSYTTLRPGNRAECHLMQARWTPQL